jgi:hypothetical protein
MKKGSVFGFIILIIFTVLVIGVAFKVSPLAFLLGGRSEKPTNKSGVNELIGSLEKTKPSSQGGIIPQPPREAIRLVEKFISLQEIRDTTINYRLSIDFGTNQEIYDLVVSAASKPFRWRIEFIDPKTNYQTIFINNVNTYYTCNSYEKTCAKSSLDEVNIPLPLINFLNAFLDSLQLKKFVNKTPETTVKTIAYKATDCLKASDEKQEVEVCTERNSGMILLIFLKRKLDKYTLEGKKIDVATLSAETFSPPYPLP